MESANLLAYIGFALIFLGIALIIIAFILFAFRGVEKAGKVKGGGIIFVGPFPIIFGTDKESLKTVILLAIILIAAMVGLILGLNMLKT